MNAFDFDFIFYIFIFVVLRNEITTKFNFALFRYTKRNELKRIYCYAVILTFRAFHYVFKLSEEKVGKETVVSLQICNPTFSSYFFNLISFFTFYRAC